MIRRLPPALLALVLLPLPAFAEIVEPKKAEPSPFDHLELRNVGPVNMSGRVADVEGVPGRPNVVYVGAASGGVWKTTDGGLTFKPIFDDEPIASIGDLALAPSNPEVIYVGTGESNTRNHLPRPRPSPGPRHGVGGRRGPHLRPRPRARRLPLDRRQFVVAVASAPLGLSFFDAARGGSSRGTIKLVE